ncbi:ATP-grasp domain-containing protein [Spirillospora sp. NPDC047279]|uniref:ATP-grasp domain-containing protein n=1 Tax=Spirillospora sp. NPDC047279 TaxID=3155478 RepID=UPI0034022380
MPTLVLSPRYTDDSKVLRAAAGAAGWKTERLGGWRAPGHLRGQDVVLYGEPTFVEVIAARLGVGLVDAPHDWLLGLPERHRRREVNESTLEAVRRSLNEPMFVKPADGRKAFEGTVYRAGDDLPGEDVLPGETPVLVGEPVTWEIEFRCFVLAGEVVTMSPYLRDGGLARTAAGRWEASEEDVRAAGEYAAGLLAEVPVPPAVVVDVGRIRDRGWAVVEANAAWGAGLYGCDPAAVLPVLARSCAPGPADTQWTVERLELTD